ncbi:hypothetical protein CFP66_23405 [Pseudonocardia sp. MH-G8]|nr:hypothetical protein CFP66_23405 [Pseudonocardia sp. MH-G8]
MERWDQTFPASASPLGALFPERSQISRWRCGRQRAGRASWPTAAAVAMVATLAGLSAILLLIDLEPWRPADVTTFLIPGLAIAYLVFGARGQLRRPGVLRLEIVGLVLFGSCALLAVLVDPRAGQYVAGAAWIGHAAWDVAHHRDLSHHHAVGVVPRGYAEFFIRPPDRRLPHRRTPRADMTYVRCRSHPADGLRPARAVALVPAPSSPRH